MSSLCVDYILHGIRQFLGEDIENLSRYLMNNDTSTMDQIFGNLKHLNKKNIREGLKILIDNNFVSFNYSDIQLDSYEFDIDGYLAFKRCDRFLNIIDKIFGPMEKTICETLFVYGNLSVTEIIKRSQQFSNGDNNWPTKIGCCINELVKKSVLEGAPMFLFERKVEDNKKITDVFTNVHEITEYFANELAPEIVRKRKLDADIKSWNMHYCINRNTLNRLCQNEIIADNARYTHGDEAGIVMSTFLSHLHSPNMDSYTEPISETLLLRQLKTAAPQFNEDIFADNIFLLTRANPGEAYMEVINNQNGTLYGYNDRTVITQLAIKQLAVSVKVIFGQNGLILFNFLLAKPYTEENVFLRDVMLPQDLIRSLLPNMINKGYISKLEVSKSKQYFDEPLVSLFFVDVNHLVRIEQQTCYQCLYNVAVRQVYDETKQKALVTKFYEVSEKIDKVDGSSSVEDVEEIVVITDNDRKALQQLNNGLYKLEAAEYSVVTSLIIFESHIKHQNETGGL